MADTLIIIAEILGVAFVLLSSAILISVMFDKLLEGFGSGGLIGGVIGICVGVVMGVSVGGYYWGQPGSHLGGVIGALVGIAAIYAWLRVA